MVKHHLGKCHYILINLALIFDMYSSTVVYLFLSAEIFQSIMANRHIILSLAQVSFVIIIITFLGFSFSFFPVKKITFFSYLGIKYFELI